MGLDDLVHDAILVNQPYAGLGAEAYDVWMPPSGDDPDVEVCRRRIERGAGRRWSSDAETGDSWSATRAKASMSRASTADLDAQYEWRVRRSGTRPGDGVTFMAHEAVRIDVEAQTEHVLNRHELWSAGGELITTYLRRHRLRWWTREQLEGMLRTCDYVDVRSHGGSDGFVTVGHSA